MVSATEGVMPHSLSDDVEEAVEAVCTAEAARGDAIARSSKVASQFTTAAGHA